MQAIRFLHDLKENVVTPYVMVESLGWFYGLPIFGKTFLPSLYRRWTAWLRRLFVPPMATTLTVDKLAPAETAEMLAAEQQAIVAEGAARTDRAAQLAHHACARRGLRQRAFSGEGDPEPPLVEAASAGRALDGSADRLRRHLAAAVRSESRGRPPGTRNGSHGPASPSKNRCSRSIRPCA